MGAGPANTTGDRGPAGGRTQPGCDGVKDRESATQSPGPVINSQQLASPPRPQPQVSGSLGESEVSDGGSRCKQAALE